MLGSAPAMLAAAGSGAANGAGAFSVAPGMDVLSPTGERIGRVREIVADERGQVQQVLVQARGARQLVPTGNFTAAGDALVMGSGAASGGTQAPADSAE